MAGAADGWTMTGVGSQRKRDEDGEDAKPRKIFLIYRLFDINDDNLF